MWLAQETISFLFKSQVSLICSLSSMGKSLNQHLRHPSPKKCRTKHASAEQISVALPSSFLGAVRMQLCLSLWGRRRSGVALTSSRLGPVWLGAPLLGPGPHLLHPDLVHVVLCCLP
jgi:hypothetical protein